MSKSQKPERLPERKGDVVSDPATLKKLKDIAGTVKVMNAWASVMDLGGGDVLAGLIPAVGDGAATFASLFLSLQQAQKAELPLRQQIGICMSQITDFGIGAIPIIGDLADYFFKSNIGARDRFVKHFETSLLNAWNAQKIASKDVEELSKISGIAIAI